MADNVLINKAATIERTVARVREEYSNAGDNFANDHTRQDAAILNIQRACEACLDMGQHLIAQQHLGVAQSSRDIFQILTDNNKISAELAQTLQNMVGFRNIAVHDYQKILLPIVEKIIQEHLDDLLKFSQILLKQTLLD